MPSNLPEVVRHPAVVRATAAPTALVGGAAGVGIGALDHSVVLAVILGVLGYGGRAGWLAWRGIRRRRPPPPAPVDPWSVPEPWRGLLRDAVDAQRRFTQVAQQLPPGPTRERVMPMVARIEASVRAAETSAKRSSVLMSPSRQGRADSLSTELAGLQATSPAPGGAGEAHQAAIAAQLRALRRAQAVSNTAADQLRLFIARLDDAVTGLVGLTSGDPDPGGGPPAGAVPGLLDELDALHAGLLEAGGELQATVTIDADGDGMPAAGPGGASELPPGPGTP